MFDFAAWGAWIRSLETAWLFLVILLLVLAVVALWSRSLKPDRNRDPGSD